MEERVEYLRPNLQEAEECMTTNNGPAIEEMLRDAEDAAEPGDMEEGQVISRTDNMTMTTSQLQSAGYVYVYDTRTADRSVVNRNMLHQQLEKVRPDGTYVFSTRKPEGIELNVGSLKCFLHEDDPNREKYNRMGLVHCTKANLLTEFDRDRHLQYRHRRAHATLENERVREEREADRMERRALSETIRAMNSSNNRGKRDA